MTKRAKSPGEVTGVHSSSDFMPPRLATPFSRDPSRVPHEQRAAQSFHNSSGGLPETAWQQRRTRMAPIPQPRERVRRSRDTIELSLDWLLMDDEVLTAGTVEQAANELSFLGEEYAARTGSAAIAEEHTALALDLSQTALDLEVLELWVDRPDASSLRELRDLKLRIERAARVGSQTSERFQATDVWDRMAAIREAASGIIAQVSSILRSRVKRQPLVPAVDPNMASLGWIETSTADEQDRAPVRSVVESIGT